MDLISRQDAIAEIYEDFMTIDMAVHDKSAQRCMDILGKLPSVSQPQGRWFGTEDEEILFYKPKNNKKITNGEIVEMLFPEEITNKLFLNQINFWEMPYKGKGE